MKHRLFSIACLFPSLVAFAAQASAPDPTQAARSYYAEGDYVNAAKGFEEVLRTFPADAVVINNLAVAKVANGEYRAAVELLRRAAQLAPHRRDIETNLRDLQDYLQYFDQARPVPPQDAVLPEPPSIWGETAPQGRKPADTNCTRKTCK